MKTIQKIKVTIIFLMKSLLIMLIVFYCHRHFLVWVMFFMVWVMLCYIIFLKLFPIIFFWSKINSFLITFFYKRFNFSYSLRVFFGLFMIQHDCYCELKTYVIFFVDGIYCCIFVFHPIRRIFIWSTTIRIYFMAFIIQ